MDTEGKKKEEVSSIDSDNTTNTNNTVDTIDGDIQKLKHGKNFKYIS